MPRYHFNVEDGSSNPDEGGTELASIEAARAHALRYAGQLLSEAGDHFWSGGEWKMTVTDHCGLSLFTLIFLGVDAPSIRASSAT